MSKPDERTLALQRRAALSETERNEYSAIICGQIAALPCFKAAETVFSYMAIDSEVDLSALEAYGKRTAYPKCEKRGVMQAYVSEEFTEGVYGIREPVPEKSTLVPPEEFDLVLVPCVGFDGALNRLGHGGGYYDRYLPMCKNAVFICAAFEAQKLEAVSTDEFDIKMHRVVTERGVYGEEK